MSELTTPVKIEIPGIGTIESADLYLKSEADKVIADLEESHKKEVEQLLMEIVKLKADYREACGRLQTANLIKDEQLAATSHSNHKRCLAMAKVCYLRFLRYENYLQKLCASNATIAAYKFRRDLYDKWENRWLELTEKFNETK